MHLTRFTDYSLRVLMLLALVSERLITIDDMAHQSGISRNHLTKIVHQLSLLGYVETARGRNGGVRLAGRPEDIGLGDVVRDCEGSMEIAECFAPDTKTCPIESCCRLQPILREALGAFLAVLDQYTLRDLLSHRSELLRLLEGGAAR